MKLLCVYILVNVLFYVNAIHDGALPTPLMGWSTWNAFACSVSDSLIRTSADYLRSSPLYTAGYNYILLDDCWTSCDDANSDGTCNTPTPRSSSGELIPDASKFPSGMKALVDYVHSVGLKFGIYSAPSTLTCAGYQGSLGYEDIDGKQFASWGVDFLKYDTCGSDCSVHTGCVQSSTIAISSSLRSSSSPSIKPIIYIDAGDPANINGVINPDNLYIGDETVVPHMARNYTELVPIWGQEVGHMWKIWWDMWDNFDSTMYNVHKNNNLELFQTCGSYNIPDMLTVGLGGQTEAEYRAQFFLWAVLASPLILGNDIRTFNAVDLALVTSPEILAVNQDSFCLQGTLVQSTDGPIEIYVKMLSNGTFVAVFVNKDAKNAASTTFHTSSAPAFSPTLSAIYSSFWPAGLYGSVTVRDLFTRTTVTVLENAGDITVTVQPHDALIYQFFPTQNPVGEE